MADFATPSPFRLVRICLHLDYPYPFFWVRDSINLIQIMGMNEVKIEFLLIIQDEHVAENTKRQCKCLRTHEAVRTHAYVPLYPAVRNVNDPPPPSCVST